MTATAATARWFDAVWTSVYGAYREAQKDVEMATSARTVELQTEKDIEEVLQHISSV